MTLHSQVPPDAMQHDDDAQAGQGGWVQERGSPEGMQEHQRQKRIVFREEKAKSRRSQGGNGSIGTTACAQQTRCQDSSPGAPAAHGPESKDLSLNSILKARSELGLQDPGTCLSSELPTEGYDVDAGDGDANKDTDEDGGEVTTSMYRCTC